MKNSFFNRAVLASISVAFCANAMATEGPKTLSPKNKTVKHAVVETSRMEWWNKARFGMFIHWGVYSVPAGVYEGKNYRGLGEWLMHDAKIPVATYKAYAKSFNPTQYDPEKWVLMAKAAGMKYIVITTKHHDGFAMFDSKASDWNIVKQTPYGKDVIKMLADACRKYKMKLGFYYSQANDWSNAGGAAAGGHWDKAQDGSFDEYIDKVAVPQVKEILTNYGDVAELWWDVPTDMTAERAAKFLPFLKANPNIVANNRLGGGIAGDVETPEQYIPATGIPGKHWETCMTMNDTWGFKTNDHNWKSSKTLIRNLVDIASKGGNYLLNVGPEATGKFPEPIVAILDDMGKWMKLNSESIYETTASPFKKLPWGRVTAKAMPNGNTILYLNVFDWPSSGELVLPGLKNEVLSAVVSASKRVLKPKRTADGVSMIVPKEPVDEVSSVIKLVIKGKINVVTIIPSANADGSFTLDPNEADLKGSVQVEGGNTPNFGYWTDAKSVISWRIKITKPGTYSIEAPAAALNDNNSINIAVGDQSVQANIKGTERNNNYQLQNLGEIKIAKAGINTVTITAVPTNWQYINLRAITFKPVN